MSMMIRRNKMHRAEKSALVHTAPIVNDKVAEKTYTKSEITLMGVDDLKTLAKKLGIDSAETMTGAKLKPAIIEKLGL